MEETKACPQLDWGSQRSGFVSGIKNRILRKIKVSLDFLNTF